MPAKDMFKDIGSNLDDPAIDVFLITPDDDNELDYVTRGIWLSVAGDIHVVTIEDRDIVLPEELFIVGVIYSIRIKKIFATGTTATIYGVI